MSTNEKNVKCFSLFRWDDSWEEEKVYWSENWYEWTEWKDGRKEGMEEWKSEWEREQEVDGRNDWSLMRTL